MVRLGTSLVKGKRQRSVAPTRNQSSTVGTGTALSTPATGVLKVSPCARSDSTT